MHASYLYVVRLQRVLGTFSAHVGLAHEAQQRFPSLLNKVFGTTFSTASCLVTCSYAACLQRWHRYCQRYMTWCCALHLPWLAMRYR